MISEDTIEILLPFVVQTETDRKGQCTDDLYKSNQNIKKKRDVYSINRKSSFDNEMDKRIRNNMKNI